jgi:phosphoribosylformylglycinamidine cyclo-ligase
MSGLDYEKAGVSIRKGDDFARFIKGIPSKAVSKGIGGFAGGAALDLRGYREPVLLSTTDGVGTKLLVAKKLGRYDTIGIDLVAMSVNDLVVCGARPMQFLDYIACGKIDEDLLHAVIEGVVAGCEQASCELTGGETAEMPDVYGPDDIDLAGFAVGIVEKNKMLPRLDRMEEGDLVLGMPSAGVHSNGYSLARKAVDPEDRATWQELLVPTKIYVRELLDLISTGRVLGAAHITGSGLAGNVERVIPRDLRARFDWDWAIPPIFAKIQSGGKVDDDEMRSVFNMGVGMAVIAKREEAEGLVEIAAAKGIALFRAGELVRG